MNKNKVEIHTYFDLYKGRIVHEATYKNSWAKDYSLSDVLITVGVPDEDSERIQKEFQKNFSASELTFDVKL